MNWKQLVWGTAVLGLAGTMMLPYGMKVKAAAIEPQPSIHESVHQDADGDHNQEKQGKRDTQNKEDTQDKQHKQHKHKRLSALLQEASEAIGISEEELRNQLKAGKSITDAAKAKGVSEADLLDRMLDSRMKKIDKAVKSGKWTEEQADKIRQKLPEHMRIVIHHKGEWKHGNKEHHKRDKANETSDSTDSLES